jgi:hypothetical protein
MIKIMILINDSFYDPEKWLVNGGLAMLALQHNYKIYDSDK